MTNLEELTTEELRTKQEVLSSAGTQAAAHGVELPETARDEYDRITAELLRRRAAS
ncbi:MAG: hypothetical protein RKU31_44905 [Deltaproteobacteria bacterium]|jgi:hypothetical protein